MQSERVLYPCYFNRSLKRREGRRVPRKMAVEHPAVRDIEQVLSSLRLEYRIEQAHHPAHWIEREGRILVEGTGMNKQELIKKVAAALKEAK